jgi:hypothetical protein
MSLTSLQSYNESLLFLLSIVLDIHDRAMSKFRMSLNSENGLHPDPPAGK